MEQPVVVVELVSLKWMIGIIMFPGGSALVAILWLLRLMRVEQVAQRQDIVMLLKMHNEADKMVSSIERTQKAMIHYIRWVAVEMTGKSPPPPVE